MGSIDWDIWGDVWARIDGDDLHARNHSTQTTLCQEISNSRSMKCFCCRVTPTRFIHIKCFCCCQLKWCSNAVLARSKGNNHAILIPTNLSLLMPFEFDGHYVACLLGVCVNAYKTCLSAAQHLAGDGWITWNSGEGFVSLVQDVHFHLLIYILKDWKGIGAFLFFLVVWNLVKLGFVWVGHNNCLIKCLKKCDDSYAMQMLRFEIWS